MKKLVWTILPILVLSVTASAQSYLTNFGINGGYAHVTGDQGLNGFDIGGEIVIVRPVSIAFDYDGLWNTSTLGNFALTSVGQVSLHSHLQNGLIGPRIYFPTNYHGGAVSKGTSDSGGCVHTSWLRYLDPFVEAQFGLSNLNESVTQTNVGSESASNTAFTWELGGGADVRLAPNWAFRTKLDFLRTHFANEGQSHLRLVLGVAYSFKTRPGWE